MKASLRNAYEKDAVRIVPKNFDIYAVGVEGRASIHTRTFNFFLSSFTKTLIFFFFVV